MRPDSVGAAECRRRGARRHQKIKHDRSTRPAAYWFIDSKKSSLVLESFILSSRNSIASTVPICIWLRRSPHIFASLSFSTCSSSFRTSDDLLFWYDFLLPFFFCFFPFL